MCFLLEQLLQVVTAVRLISTMCQYMCTATGGCDGWKYTHFPRGVIRDRTDQDCHQIIVAVPHHVAVSQHHDDAGYIRPCMAIGAPNVTLAQGGQILCTVSPHQSLPSNPCLHTRKPCVSVLHACLKLLLWMCYQSGLYWRFSQLLLFQDHGDHKSQSWPRKPQVLSSISRLAQDHILFCHVHSFERIPIQHNSRPASNHPRTAHASVP